MNTTTRCPPCCELAHRVGGGIEVTLYWCQDDDTTSIEIWEASSARTVVVPVDRSLALDAFYHPFVHLTNNFDDSVPWLGVERVG